MYKTSTSMPIIRSNYPHDWERRSTFIRFYRARNACEVCHHPGTGKVVLQTMHLNHDTFDNRLLNLACVCPKCHNNYDLEKRLQTRYNKPRRFITLVLDDILTEKRKMVFFHLFRKRDRHPGQLKLKFYINENKIQSTQTERKGKFNLCNRKPPGKDAGELVNREKGAKWKVGRKKGKGAKITPEL